jgi:hypothetical protein
VVVNGWIFLKKISPFSKHQNANFIFARKSPLGGVTEFACGGGGH